MKPVFTLRPAEPERDFGQLAALFSSWETNPSNESGLKEWYAGKQASGIRLVVAADADGQIGGLNCLYARDSLPAQRWDGYLLVAAGLRRQGLGRQLYADWMQAALALTPTLSQREREADAPPLRLYIGVRDDDPDSLAFAERRGFRQRAHAIEMMLDLTGFDERPYLEMVARLQTEGFVFTTMAELGDTEEAQRKLYHLNSSAAATTPGSEGEVFWSNFEEFQQSVCGANWYRPEGQFVVIDSRKGQWAAMSAITRFEGADSAYNLFTGVDMPYRGRKLAQAVKALALGFARQQLGADKVRTNHTALNAPMLAIDRKMGYVQTPGMYGLVKEI